MTEFELPGCTIEPLGSYLKALGVLQLVSEQADPTARGWWKTDAFVLRSRIDHDELLDFFLDRYEPTPLVAPWNGGSGFGEKDKKPREVVDAVAATTAARLRRYREAIAVSWRLVERARTEGWDKDRLLLECRAWLPDDAAAWLDAVVVLAEGRNTWPPLLGTGGNDGRFEFSSNFMQRVLDVLCLREERRAPGRVESRHWLEHALFATGTPRLHRGPVGQFDPSAAGTANSSPLGSAASLVNPWDWVLMLEGALLFAAAPARRMSVGATGTASVPFTVEGSPIGLASPSGSEDSRGEVWVPIWERPASAAEIAHLISEGRAEWAGRQARRAVDMVRSIASMGVDRGIGEFARYAITTRFGRNMLAVPAGRFEVASRPRVPVLRQLDGWLERIRRGSQPPAGVRERLYRVDAAMFKLARGGVGPIGEAQRLQSVLIAIADLEDTIGRAKGFRERNGAAPVSRIPAADWLALLDDGSDEFRIAAALALQYDEPGDSLRRLLRPVSWDPGRWQWQWAQRAAPVAGLGLRPLSGVLADALVKRVRSVQRRSEREPSTEQAGTRAGLPLWFRVRRPAPLGSVARLVDQQLDQVRVTRLLTALLLLDPWKDVARLTYPAQQIAPPPTAWALLAPFFAGHPIDLQELPAPVELIPEPTWPARLAAGSIEPVIEAALRRLRIAGLAPAFPRTAGRVGTSSAPASAAIARTAPPPHLLAAALLCPLSRGGVTRLIRQVVPEALDVATAPLADEQGVIA